MNTDPASTRSPHLDLEDLIEEITGQATGDRAREHIAACERCRAEANRWTLVADGVRGLAAVAPEVAQPAGPRRTGPWVLTGPGRRATAAASAAAALVVLGGAGYGLFALTGHAPGRAGTSATTAALTAVPGCAGLRQADGTLERVNGTSLVIKTSGGSQVTVTTSGATKVSMSRAPLSDITDGTPVVVSGHSSGGTIAAERVTLGSQPQPFPQPRPGKVQVPPGVDAVRGTVADASTAGFTVVTSGGTRVPVTTSTDTAVNISRASLSELRAGATTHAIGYPAAAGSLSAIAILSGRQGIVDIKGCSPAAVDGALATALVSG
jgi:hypothetical protein